MAPVISKEEEAPAGRTMAQRLKLLQGALGIYFFFIQYGRLQERVVKFKSPSGEKFDAIWFLQVVDALANMLVGGVGRYIGATPAAVPQQFLAVSGLFQVYAKYAFSASLAAGVSFHVATLAKSAKMVPVMIGSFLSGQSFGTRQIAQAAAIVGGTSMVTMSEGAGKSGSSSMAGLSYIALALACDGAVGGVQKKMKIWCKKQGMEYQAYNQMYWTNFYMMLGALFAAASRNELRKGWTFCRKNPEVLKLILMFSACGALGQASIFSTISAFDSVTATAITTTRKLASVLLSLFENPDTKLSLLGWSGLAVASAGIMGEAI